MNEPFRCSAASVAATEPLEGTASTVRRFLLLESPGPWGVDALRGDRLDPDVRRWLAEAETYDVRPLLVRRPRRSATGGARLLVADAVTGTLVATTLTSQRALLDLRPEAVADGTAELAPQPGPLFLACTHGKHDACCAELGRPLAAALAAVAPDETWEVSHVGGDRFAPNVVVLPHGLYYGRLLPAEAGDFVATHHDGRLDLEHLRGRSSYAFAVQAAEIHLRRHLDHHAVQPLPLLSRTRHGAETTAVFEHDGRRWTVKVRTTRTVPTRLTCRASAPSAALRHELLAIEQSRVAAPEHEGSG